MCTAVKGPLVTYRPPRLGRCGFDYRGLAPRRGPLRPTLAAALIPARCPRVDAALHRGVVEARANDGPRREYLCFATLLLMVGFVPHKVFNGRRAPILGTLRWSAWGDPPWAISGVRSVVAAQVSSCILSQRFESSSRVAARRARVPFRFINPTSLMFEWRQRCARARMFLDVGDALLLSGRAHGSFATYPLHRRHSRVFPAF